MAFYVIDSPIGLIKIVEKAGFITEIKETSEPVSDFPVPASLEKAVDRIKEYFSGKEVRFDFPVNAAGSEFQLSVWNQCKRIPFGHTASYGEIALAIGKPLSARAVGNALGLNPLLLVVPCHRIVSKNGLGGFRLGPEVKKILIELERRPTRDNH